MSQTLDAQHTLSVARSVLNNEADALRDLAARLSQSFVAAAQRILACHGRVVLMGMGKSGHIAGKIAATLASTGTPAFYVHPGEAAHGDLGMVTPSDLVIAVSYSGESAELLTLLPYFKRHGIGLIAVTGNAGSSLARAADVHLDAHVDKEACPLGLAPTTSTTAALALGDALALTLLDARGFAAEDFAVSHPGGSLGRKLLVRVSDVMHQGERLPRVRSDVSMSAALIEMSSKGLGMTAIVDDVDRLLGVFTDGDLRRALERGVDLRNANVEALMTRSPHTIGPDQLAAEAVQVMQQFHILSLVVVDNGQRLVGALNMHDLFQAGVV